MPYRYTLIMQVTTTPGNLETSSAHTGGWSESHWHPNALTPTSSQFRDVLLARARMLPRQAAITGYRIANYSIVGSSLKPQGASTGKVRFPGNPARETDLPQVALEFGGAAGGGNSNRFSARCIPDDVMEFGEYQANATYKGYVTQYCNALVNGGFGFIGRDLTQQVIRIKTIDGSTMVLYDSIGVTLGETLFTFIKVKDVLGSPIVGNFRVTALPGGVATYTMAGLPQNTSVVDSGSVRILVPQFCLYSSVTPARAVVRKVGRPFEQYRGRASKRRTLV